MNNYEYILASLPEIRTDSPMDAALNPGRLIEDILAQLSPKDLRAAQTVLDGFDRDKLTPEFYAEALKSGNGFIRGYFARDLQVRNAKVRYLNAALGLDPEQGTIVLNEDATDDREDIDRVLALTDILEREKGLDKLMAAAIGELTVLHIFDLDLILGAICKLKMIERWMNLDPVTGREMFHKLVEKIRNNRNI